MSIEEIYQEMVQAVQRETGLTLAGDGDMAVRLYAVAAQVYGLYVQADWVGRQCFPQTAQGEFLDRHAQLRGVERRAAAAAQGVLRFERDSAAETDLLIGAGSGRKRWRPERRGTWPQGRCGLWRWRRWG